MKLYDFSLAPSPRRVRMFLVEKGVEIPTVEINTREREQFRESYRQVNQNCVVPTLVLDDGTCLGESVAICRYIERLHPTPCLMGDSPIVEATIEMWNRRAEIEGYLAAADIFRNSSPIFEGRGVPGVEGGVPQIPALVVRGRHILERFSEKLDRQLDNNRYVAGDEFSIADITAYVSLDLAKRADVEISGSCNHVIRWFSEMGRRPSAAA